MAELNATQQAFVDRYAPYANLASQQLGLPSRVILAKLAVETGWGQHFANNNLPGLKTGNSAQNDGFSSVKTATWEDYGGSGRTNIKDGFIRYPTPEQSIGGLVPWLTNSTYMNSLADRRGGGIFDRDAAAEASAVQALGSSGFSTDRNASAKVTDVLGKLPDLSSYGIAPSFTPAINQLMNYVPYDTSGRPNFSEGLGGFTNNDYYSGTEFQPGGGVVLPRERGADGLELPSPTMGPTIQSPGLLDTLANGADAVGRGLSNLFGGGSADAASTYNPNVNPLAFAGGSNVGGGRPGAFTDFLPPLQTGGATNFSGLNPGDAFGAGNGSFGSGIAQPGPAPDPYGFSGGNFAGGVGLGSLSPGLTTTPQGDTASTIGPPAASGGLPPFFSPVDYVNANPDLAAAGITPQTAAQHFLDYGQFETRALAPWLQAQVHAAPGGSQTIGGPGPSPTLGPSTTPTLGSGSTASTIGAPNAIGGLPPGFDAQTYALANPDVAASGQDPTQHFLRWGQYDVRSLGPGQEARVHAAPGSISPYGGTVQASTLGPFGTTPTIGPDGGVNVVSTGLTPTVGPGATVQSFSPGGGNDYLTMPSTTATTLGPPATSNSLPAFFSPQDYIAANRDLAGMSNQQAIDHYTNYGQYEARALAPWLEAQVHAAPGLTPTIGAGNPVSTIGAPSLTPTLDTASFAPTIQPPALTGTYGAPSLTPTLNTAMPTPSWSPFGGAGVASPFGFSGSNVGSGLGAGPQSFGSIWPVGDSYAAPQPSAGPDMSNPFGFTSLDASGFDAGALGSGGGGGGGSVNEMGISGGFDSEGAMRRVLEQQAEAIRLADLAAKTPMHTNPNAWNVAIANGGTLGLGTPLQTPGAVGGPVVPDLTTANLNTGRPSAGGFGGGMPFVLGMPFAR